MKSLLSRLSWFCLLLSWNLHAAELPTRVERELERAERDLERELEQVERSLTRERERLLRSLERAERRADEDELAGIERARQMLAGEDTPGAVLGLHLAQRPLQVVSAVASSMAGGAVGDTNRPADVRAAAMRPFEQPADVDAVPHQAADLRVDTNGPFMPWSELRLLYVPESEDIGWDFLVSPMTRVDGEQPPGLRPGAQEPQVAHTHLPGNDFTIAKLYCGRGELGLIPRQPGTYRFRPVLVDEEGALLVGNEREVRIQRPSGADAAAWEALQAAGLDEMVTGPPRLLLEPATGFPFDRLQELLAAHPQAELWGELARSWDDAIMSDIEDERETLAERSRERIALARLLAMVSQEEYVQKMRQKAVSARRYREHYPEYALYYTQQAALYEEWAQRIADAHVTLPAQQEAPAGGSPRESGNDDRSEPVDEEDDDESLLDF